MDHRQNQNLRDRAPPPVPHEDCEVVPSWMDVTLPTGPHHEQSQLHLEVIQHLFRDLSVVLRTCVARLSHSHANQTVTRVPQTWFTIPGRQHH